MNRCESAEDLAGFFVEHLRRIEQERSAVSAVTSFENGAEGWLKFELACAVKAAYHALPGRGDEDNDLVLECRSRLTPGSFYAREYGVRTKRVDLAVRAAPKSTFHSVELKIVTRRHTPYEILPQKGAKGRTGSERAGSVFALALFIDPPHA